MEGNILFFTSWGFKEGLVQAYTLPYLKIIANIRKSGKIFLVTEEKDARTISTDGIDAVNKSLAPFEIIWMPRPYQPAGIKKLAFMFKELLYWKKIAKEKNIEIFHSLCTPAGVYAYLLKRLTGKKLIIDSFEPHTMYMLESGVWKERSLTYKMLRYFEGKMARSADYIIATTNGMKEFSRKTYGVKDTHHFFVKPACVDLETFRFSQINRNQIRQQLGINPQKKVGIYVGKLGGIYLSNEVFEFLKTAYDYWNGNFFLLLLSPHSEEEVKAFCEMTKFPYEALILKSVAHSEVPAYLSAADFGLTPVKPTPSKKYCTPMKDGEYWAAGLPVVITKDISDDSDIIENEGCGAVIRTLDKQGYLRALDQLDEMLKSDDLQLLRNRVSGIAEKYRNFNVAASIYSKIYGG